MLCACGLTSRQRARYPSGVRYSGLAEGSFSWGSRLGVRDSLGFAQDVYLPGQRRDGYATAASFGGKGDGRSIFARFRHASLAQGGIACRSGPLGLRRRFHPAFTHG
jgi:hypothetical protein